MAHDHMQKEATKMYCSKVGKIQGKKVAHQNYPLNPTRETVSCDGGQCGCLKRTGRLAKQHLQQPALEDAFKNAGQNASVCMHRVGKGSGT